MAQRDPMLILWWLRHRISAAAVPERQVAIEFAMRGDGGTTRNWLLVARATEPELCLEDPQLSEERYVYVEADAADLYRIARGIRPVHLHRPTAPSTSTAIRNLSRRCPTGS
jgi:hypothetical protein